MHSSDLKHISGRITKKSLWATPTGKFQHFWSCWLSNMRMEFCSWERSISCFQAQALIIAEIKPCNKTLHSRQSYHTQILALPLNPLA